MLRIYSVVLNSHHVFIFNRFPIHGSLVKTPAHCNAFIQERGCHKLLCISGDYILSKETENCREQQPRSCLVQTETKIAFLRWSKHERAEKEYLPDPNTLAASLVFLFWIVGPKHNPVFIGSEDLNEHRLAGLLYQNLSSLPVNSSSCTFSKRELPENRLTTLNCSKSISNKRN